MHLDLSGQHDPFKAAWEMFKSKLYSWPHHSKSVVSLMKTFTHTEEAGGWNVNYLVCSLLNQAQFHMQYSWFSFLLVLLLFSPTVGCYSHFSCMFVNFGASFSSLSSFSLLMTVSHRTRSTLRSTMEAKLDDCLSPHARLSHEIKSIFNNQKSVKNTA